MSPAQLISALPLWRVDCTNVDTRVTFTTTVAAPDEGAATEYAAGYCARGGLWIILARKISDGYDADAASTSAPCRVPS